MTVFSDVYKTNAWNGSESLSGPGSGSASTKLVARDLLALVEELGIGSVLDVGCGDSFWLPDLPGYIGVDVAPEAVERARSLHPDRYFEVIDGTLARAELVLCRDVIQHLAVKDALALLDAIRESGAHWLLASTYIGGRLEDIVTGADAWSPDLTNPPFTLGDPERYIFDGYDWEDSLLVRDVRKMLGLWRLNERPNGRVHQGHKQQGGPR